MKTSEPFRTPRTSGLAVLICFVLGAAGVGCRQQRAPSGNAIPPFVFRSLDLNQRRSDGTRDWDLQSPEARYSLDSRTVRAVNPKGLLYRQDQPSFQIRAELATVLNDGELVVLEGGVELQQLNQRRVTITGDRLVWTPSQSQMVIDQNPRAVDETSELSVDHLTFDVQQDTLLFRGDTVWTRWPEERSNDKPPSSTATSRNGFWNLQSGTLESQGPVQIKRTAGETITAPGLVGNTLKQHIDLLSPVLMTLPKDQGKLTTGKTHWDFGRQELTTKADVLATLKKTTIKGRGFRVNQVGERVTIPSGCELVQPDQQLTAQRCSWNWGNDSVVAEGNVVLKRDALDQTTRASRLEGVLNDDGVIRFGAPGRRVTSTIKLKTPNQSDETNRPPVSF